MGATDRDDGNGNANVPDAPAHSRATSVDTVSRSNSMCVFDSFGDGELEHERVHRVTPGIELERRAEASRDAEATSREGPAALPRLLDCSGILQDACAAMVDDSFNRCFQESNEAPWNFNFYLAPLWWCGLVIRYGVLFPLRLAFLLTASAAFAVSFAFSHYCLPKKWGCERKCVELYAAAFVVSWTGVIKYHGPRPSRRGNRGGVVYVSNHTSMIDYLVLTQVSPFAVIQQKHKGWVGLLQRTAMSAIDCIEFNLSLIHI